MDEMEYLTAIPTNSRRTLADTAAEQLRSAIRNGKLKPDTRLVEREIAERLGVSRVPVREAIQQLVEEGLARKIPRHGTFVYAPSWVELEEIASLRMVLEQFAVERVMTRWNPKFGMRLEWIVNDMQTAVANCDCAQLLEADEEFHLALWQMADHSLLVDIASSLRARISKFLFQAVEAQKDSPLFAEYVKQHTQVIEAIRSGDVARAKHAMATHVAGATSQILKFHGWATVPDGADGLRVD